MLVYWTNRLAWALSRKDTTAQVPVGALFVSSDIQNQAIPKVVAALRCIQQVDAVRSRRIKRQVKRILVVGSRLVAYGIWYRPLRMISLADDWVKDNATSCERIALTIVHEATHARLWCFGYDEPLRGRVERICNYQALVFASRLPEGATLVAIARAAMDRDPEDYSTERRRRRILDALETVLPKRIVALVARFSRGRAA